MAPTGKTAQSGRYYAASGTRHQLRPAASRSLPCLVGGVPDEAGWARKPAAREGGESPAGAASHTGKELEAAVALWECVLPGCVHRGRVQASGAWGKGV